MRRVLIVLCLVLISKVFTACDGRGDEGDVSGNGVNTSTTRGSMPLGSDQAAAILLFNGKGTSPGDVAAIEKILANNHLNYSTVNSSQLNRMSESQIRAHQLLIVPGGNFINIGNGLTSNSTSNIQSAVHNGLNYLGICAGAFFAGDSGYNGLNLTSGIRFSFYAAEDRGIRKAAVPIVVAGAPTLEHYWEDGPQLSGWGSVVGKYPDGTPAIVQGTFGDGWVLLLGCIPKRQPVGGRE